MPIDFTSAQLISFGDEPFEAVSEMAQGWNMIFRLYGPLEPWYAKTWRPGEPELVK